MPEPRVDSAASTVSPANILFVCTGNICRSPLAEVIAGSMFDGDDFRFSSAGTHVLVDCPAAQHAQTVAHERGLSLSDHRAVSLDMCEAPDFVIGMEQHHLVAARRAFPRLDITRYRLLDHPVAIVDPYGYELDAYEVAADHIERALAGLLESLRSPGIDEPPTLKP